MSTTAALRVPRQSLVLATAASLHFAAFMLVASVRLQHPSYTEPQPIIARIIPLSVKPIAPVAPASTGAVDYERLPVPPPDIDWPDLDETRAPASGPTAATSAGEGPGAPAAEFIGPVLRTRDSRLAGLVDRCYPAAARRRGEEGRVGVRVTIDARGRAAAVGVAQSSGFAQLDAAADCVVGMLEFEPARRAGTAVDATVQLPILFRLD